MTVSRDASLLSVVHEDADLLVLDKPAGLVCHPSKQGPTSSLIGRVRLHLGHDEGRLVNRLDRETSGIVIVAKSREAAGELGRLFAGQVLRKRYLAVVHGVLHAEQTIDAPLGKDTASPVAIKDCVRHDGAAARTRVRPLASLSHGRQRLTLVEVLPETGRKHQIRIHLSHIGCPVVGDKIYGGDERRYLRFVEGGSTEADREALIVEYHALHAREVEFVWRDRQWRFGAPVPARLAALAGDVTDRA